MTLPRVLYRSQGGVGDALMVSAVARELALRGEEPWVSTRFPALYRHNPDIRGHLPVVVAQALKRLVPGTVRSMNYEHAAHGGGSHVLEKLGYLVGLPASLPYGPRLYLTPEEIAWGLGNAAGAILIQTEAQTGWTPNKNWYFERFQEVSDRLRPKARVIQIGTGPGPSLRGAEDWRNRTSLRQVASLLKAARVFVGLEGALMHLAKAVDARAVIVFGGYVSPMQTGYSSHGTLFTPLDCAPCWKTEPCPFHSECMNRITADDAIRELGSVVGLEAMPNRGVELALVR